MTDTIVDEAPVRAAQRDNLRRVVEFRSEPSDDGLTLEGYAAVFNEWAEITDRAGAFQERIAPGAFKRTLGDKTPILQFDHGTHPLIGSIPLGRFTSITEDERGLKVRARLSDNWLIEPVRDAIRDGGITGMSFRFRVVNEEWEQRDGADFRTITQVDLFEAGPVVTPAYSGTAVGVRSRQTALALTDPEVRREVASLLTLGAEDIRAIADESLTPPSDLPSGAPTIAEALPITGAQTATTYSKSKRRALASLILTEPGGSK